MIDFEDIKRQKGRWMYGVLLEVESISETDGNDYGGLFQIIKAYDYAKQYVTVIYEFKTEIEELTNETPCQMIFQIRQRDGWWQGVPEE
jgi:hypothetical protein